MVQLMPLRRKTPSSRASFKSRLVLPFWYRLTQAVLEEYSYTGVVYSFLRMKCDCSEDGASCSYATACI